MSRAEQILERLNDSQREAATSFGAPVVVLAGAGTGKTRTITHRIAYGALTGEIDAGHSLAVTFTTKAAGEMRERLVRLGVPRVQARTFHSAALRQLTYFWPRAYGSPLPNLAESSYPMVAQAARTLRIEADPSLIRDLVAEVSWAKVSNVTPESYERRAEATHRSVGNLEPSQVGRVLRRYEAIKRGADVIDFDDVLLCTLAMIHEHSDVAEQIRDQYRYFTVDEFQDVSPVQRALLDVWVDGRDEICVVGDPNQCIHSFAGANPDYLRSFTAEHPRATSIRLQTNYRSTPEILGAANTLLTTADRLRATCESGEPVEFVSATDEADELAETAAWLVARHEEGMAWRDMAVCFRINAQADDVSAALRERDVPIQSRDDEGVTLTTMHAAKGAEWRAVALVGCYDGMVPFVLARTSAQIAEEKRLLYVAMTRAQERLRISWPGNRRRSRFLGGCEPAAPRRKRQTRKSLATCYVCRRPLTDATEIKLGRHLDCEVSYDEHLFARLKQWRKETAEAASMPAFVILTDATLRAICEIAPSSREQLAQIRGIGQRKLDTFCDDVLRIVAEG